MTVIRSLIFADCINCFKICFLSCFLNLLFFKNNEEFEYFFSARNKFNDCASLSIARMHRERVLVFSLNNHSAKIRISKLALTYSYLSRIRKWSIESVRFYFDPANDYHIRTSFMSSAASLYRIDYRIKISELSNQNRLESEVTTTSSVNKNRKTHLTFPVILIKCPFSFILYTSSMTISNFFMIFW